MYSLLLYLYAFLAHIVALFHKKARLMVKGHKQTWKKLQALGHNQKYIWFHAASLGEFEQGRPLMERIKKEFPERKILLTFFSPSGYEVRKNYEGADLVCYLPFDTPKNAKKFIQLANIEMAFFIKYEFWRNYIYYLYKADIPVYSVSSIFRLEQIFFKWYGYFYARILRRVTHFFVQNEASRLLLKDDLRIIQVSVVGDTRFDRVIAIKQTAKDLPLIADFTKGNFTLVCGSTWPVDEEFIIDFVKQHNCKLILAPHVVEETHLKNIEKLSEGKSVRLSQLSQASMGKQVLIIDSYGLLSSLYAYGTVAYVGGGFGVGIHNVPEAAVYGIPVIVGPNNGKFNEVQQLKQFGGVKEVDSKEAFTYLMLTYMQNAEMLKRDGEAAGNYISSHAGATDKIFKKVF